MGIREELKEQVRLKRIRMGQEAADYVEIPSVPEFRVVIVPLTEGESLAGLTRAAQVNTEDNYVGLQVKQREAVLSDVWHAMRDPSDLDQKVFTSIEDMTSTLEPNDIDHVFDALTILMDYASPAIDKISNDELDELKKAFVLIDLNELTGRRWSALKLCLSVLSPDLLLANSRSTSSTPSLTERSENDAST